MFGMAMDSVKLFLTGKLFQDTGKVLRRLAFGVGAGVIIILVLGLFVPVWLASLAGGAVAGVLQPLLFKDLKYA